MQHLTFPSLYQQEQSYENEGLQRRQKRELLFLQQSPPECPLHLVRPTFSPRTNPLALPNLLDQGIQTINQSLLRTPQCCPPPTYLGVSDTQRRGLTQGGHVRCSSTGVNGNKTSSDWGSERKSQMDWDTRVTSSHATLVAPDIKPRVFPRCPAGPEVQGPGSSPRATLNASENSMRQTLQ